MENASKALMIGASMLIALLIIGVLVFMFTNYSTVFKSQEGIKETEQLTAFNNKYEVYNKKLLRGTEVISAINQATDNNKKYEGQGEYYITIEFEMVESLVYKKDGTKGNISFVTGKKYNISDFANIKTNTDALTDFKRRVFDCEKIEYSKETGRVNYIFFKERRMSDNAYQNTL